jgi:acetyl-CoA carboxylase biotin carboxyl carrier protein
LRFFGSNGRVIQGITLSIKCNVKKRLGGKPGIDAAAIRELSQLLVETSLTEIEIERSGARIRVSRATSSVVAAAPVAAPTPAMPASVPAPAVASGPNPGAVPSPMVGTVYLAPEPGKPAFVSVGQSVEEGDTLFIVEAMKTMNPILSPRSGTVTQICVKDASPVEFGQTLLILD